MTIARDEIFGPVQSILKWDSLEEVSSERTLFALPRGVVDFTGPDKLDLSRSLDLDQQ